MALTNATNGDGETYANIKIEGSTASNSVEHYFTQVTATTSAGTRQRSITGIANAGGGKVTVTTSTDHQFIEGETALTISGTTDYDGTYTITDVLSDTTFNITASFISSQTGTASVLGWDVIMDVPDGGEPINRTNDMFFVAGNINRLYLKRCYNVQFSGTRLKQQVELGEVNRVLYVGGARGRVGSGLDDVPITGSNTGFATISYKDPSGTAAPGDGFIEVAAPSKGTALSANRQPTLNTVAVHEDKVEISAEGSTATLDSTALTTDVPLASDEVTEKTLDAGVTVDGVVLKDSNIECNVLHHNPVSLTISSNAITRTSSYHQIDTEGLAATDDLETISGGSAGDVLYLNSANNARVITIKHNVGNIKTISNTDYVLDARRKVVQLFYNLGENAWILLDN